MSDSKRQNQNHTQPKERFNGWIPKDLLAFVKQQAENEDRSVASMLARIIRSYRDMHQMGQ